MTETNAKPQNYAQKNLEALRRKTFDIKFDLESTDYEPLENIGTGAYGVVCSAQCKKSQKKVAIKKIPCVFHNSTVAERTFREMKILRHFKHDNIIGIQEILTPGLQGNNIKDIYIVLDLMESDLHRVIHSKQELTDEHVRYFLYQLLRGLKYIHSANVIHRDLKPSNLLINENCELKIGDFGMARGISSNPDEYKYKMTEYVATRWYRAPEILLTSLVGYSTAVDVWSVGCIFAEMLSRKQLFPGSTYVKQVALIINVLGSPPHEFVSHCSEQVNAFFLNRIGHREPRPLKDLFPKANSKALNLLDQMLKYCGDQRTCVEKALKHPYLSKYHDPDDEPICIPVFNFDFEKQLKTNAMDSMQLREAMATEIRSFSKPVSPPNLKNITLMPSSNQTSTLPQQTTPNQLLSNSQPSLFPGNKQVNASGTQSSGTGLDAFLKKMQQNQKASSTITKPGFQSLFTKSPVLQPVINTPAQLGAGYFKEPVSVNLTAVTKADDKVDRLASSDSDVIMLSAKFIDDTQAAILGDKLSAIKFDGDSQQDIDKLTEAEKVTKPESDKLTAIKLDAETKPDADMLSAKKVEVSDVCQQGKVAKETTEEVKPGDAKAVLKAAILNAGLRRQRLEQSGMVQPRPVTAIQRQREREEKRRKKKERALERKKNEKRKGEKLITVLTDEDKNLLARWSQMMAKPTVETKSKTGDIVASESAQSVSKALTAVSTTNVPVQNQCSTHITSVAANTLPANLVYANVNTSIANQQQVVNPLSQHASSNMSSERVVSQGVNFSVPNPPSTQMGNFPLPLQQPSLHRQQPCIDTFGDFDNIGQDHEITPQGQIGLKMTGNQYHVEQSFPKPIEVSNKEPGDLSAINLSDFLNPAAPMILPQQMNASSFPSICITDHTQSSGGTGEPFQNPATHGTVYQPPQPVLSTQPAQPILNSQSLITSNTCPAWQKQDDGMSTQHVSETGRLPSYDEALQHRVLNVPSTDTLYRNPHSTSSTGSFDDTQYSNHSSPSMPQNPGNSPSHPGVQDSTAADNVFTGQCSGWNIPTDTQQAQQPALAEHNQTQVPVGFQHLTNPGLNWSNEAQLPAQAHATPDWLGILTKQMTKSHVDDLTLTKTPKGTGGGYGVGLDLDALADMIMFGPTSAKNDSQKPESAQLSASLLADWMDVTGDMDPHEIEALEKEIMNSPMVFSEV